jgi:kynureninase
MTDTSLVHAQRLDASDPLRSMRDEFHLPLTASGDPVVYLCGNSLGLQPKGVRAAIEQELSDWATLGVEGHFDGKNPWYSYHEPLLQAAADVVGAQPHEVALMGSLSNNLHLLLVSFYRPTATRYKIVIEGDAFPSDKYAVASQARFHGYDPADAVVELHPRDGETNLRTEDIEAYLADQGASVATVMLGGVNYYTGQAFEMDRITAAGHAAGCIVGFDLAHAAGNLHLALHDWGVDFAAWCSYKYMNSGPGGVSGLFVHDRHAQNPDLPRFAGWWGNDPSTRFSMPKTFTPQRGAGGWQLSNAPVLPIAAHRAALDQFARAGIANLRTKSLAQTTYLMELLAELPGEGPEIMTPTKDAERGGQLSLRFPANGRAVHAALTEEGVVCDFREPDCIRIASAPLYTRFEDMWRFADILGRALNG